MTVKVIERSRGASTFLWTLPLLANNLAEVPTTFILAYPSRRGVNLRVGRARGPVPHSQVAPGGTPNPATARLTCKKI
jgi:hypothetical protein